MTIEQNLARYREMRTNTEKAEQENCVEAYLIRDEFIAASPSILRDLETAVEVIKVLREAADTGRQNLLAELCSSSEGCSIREAQKQVAYLDKALALASEKMGEPTSRSE